MRHYYAQNERILVRRCGGDLKIFAVGDILLGETPLCYHSGVKTTIHNEGIDSLFRSVKGLFGTGNLVFGNLESPLSDVSDVDGIWREFFRGSPRSAKGLRSAHFNALSVANNHILEHGEEAFFATIRALEESDIIPVGQQGAIKLVKIQGYTVALAGYSFLYEKRQNNCYNRVSSENPIIGDIGKIRDIADLVIVSLHWGYEYVRVPSPEQVKMAHAIIDQGADIILGTHPHVIQGYELYRGKAIFYSLGNFVIDSYTGSVRASMIAEIDVDIHTNSMNVNIIPVQIDSITYIPRIAEGNEKEKIIELISSLNREYATWGERSNSVGDYWEMVRKAQKKEKMDVKRHLVKNIHRYPPSLLIDIMKRYMKRRLEPPCSLKPDE
jgi:poly-gamma-glutamate synthesis protein (capsule biosynthesis protein)